MHMFYVISKDWVNAVVFMLRKSVLSSEYIKTLRNNEIKIDVLQKCIEVKNIMFSHGYIDDNQFI
jgi:hypothetical protein